MKKHITILLTAVLIFNLAACTSRKTEEASQVTGSTDSEVKQAGATYVDTALALSNDLYDFQIQIGSTVYQFPMKVTDFMACGWAFDPYENPEENLRSGFDNLTWFVHTDGTKVNIPVVNFAKSALPLQECYIGGITVKQDDLGQKELPVRIAKNIALGKATEQELTAAFGKATDVYDSDSLKKLSYNLDAYQTVEFNIDPKANVLTAVTICNYKIPDDFQESGLTNQIPKSVSSYKAPSFLGNELKSGIIELDGQLYQIPMPVEQLLNNGWTIQTDNSDKTIEGNYHGYVTLQKDGDTLEGLYVSNDEAYEVPVRYGMITKLDSTKIEDSLLKFPTGITVGMPLADFQKRINGQEYSIDTTSSNGITRYLFVISTWSHDGSPKNGVSVSIDNNTQKISYITISIES